MESITRPSLNRSTIKTLLFTAVFLLAFSFPAAVWAYAEDWDVTSFNVEAKLETDASAVIKESIVADYSRESHHGIYRTIPIRYHDNFGQNFNLRFSVISITDENGKNWNYEQSDDGEYVKLKVGDADTLLDKPSTFNITYRVERAVLFEDSTDEFYWNVTGEEWPVPIRNATYKLTLPAQASTNLKTICFTGGYGSTEQNCKTETQGNIITAKSTAPQAAYEGFTVAVQFPKGIINKPSFSQQLGWFLADNWGYALPFLTLAGLFYLWYTRGRDPRTGRETIMPIYEPPNKMTPGEVGTIIDESVDMRDITATMIDLAVRGYIKIRELKEKVLFFDYTDYEFEKLKDFENDGALKPHETKILKAIFGSGSSKKLSALKNEFYKDLPVIKDKIYQQLVEDGYFPSSPDAVRSFYYTIGGIMTALPIFLMGLFAVFLGISVALGLAGSGIIFLIFASRMPAKTKKGAEAKWEILGLEEYIKTAETDRIKFQEKENIFQKLLPYAMTLGIAEKWTKAFKDLIKTPPEWYQSSDPNFHSSFNTIYLLHSLDHLTSTASTTMQSSPRSSGSGGAWSGGSGFGGGGFSGGGFGGGGGGSW